MNDSRVREIREEVESQRVRWNELMSGGAKNFVGTVTMGVPVFRPHVAEADLTLLLGLAEENRKLKADLAETREVKIYAKDD